MYIEGCKTFKKHFKETAKVKFKKMTQKQRDYGKVIAIAVLSAIMIIGALSSCTVYKTPQMHITSVLAVTAQGDTLKLPIDAIITIQVIVILLHLIIFITAHIGINLFMVNILLDLVIILIYLIHLLVVDQDLMYQVLL